MNRSVLYTSEKSCRWIAILLLTCFVYVSVLPLIHSHTCFEHYEDVSDEAGNTLSSVCKVCDYFVHQQGKEFYIQYPPAVTLMLPAPIEHNGPVCAGIYEMTLNAFTNKGPPVSA